MQDRGRLEEAAALYRETVATTRRVQPGHPETMLSIHNLAALLHQMGRLEEAEGLYREALAGRQATLGAEHPHTLSTAASFERLLRDKAAAAARAAAPRRR